MIHLNRQTQQQRRNTSPGRVSFVRINQPTRHPKSATQPMEGRQKTRFQKLCPGKQLRAKGLNSLWTRSPSQMQQNRAYARCSTREETARGSGATGFN